VQADARWSFLRFISSAENDGFQDAGGEVLRGSQSMVFGDGGLVALRFEDVRIPAKAYVVLAQIQFQKKLGSFVPTSGDIWGELSADSAPFDLLPMALGARPGTTTRVQWQLGGWSMTSPRDFQSATSDIGPVVREITSLPGWTPGNAMSFFFSLTGDRLVETYESGPARAAALQVTYIDPHGLAERLAARAPVIGPRNGFSHAISFDWPAEAALPTLGLSYQIEGSSDLAEWEPVEPLEMTFGFTRTDGYRRATAIIAPEDLQLEQDYFLRIRISQAL